MLEDNRKRFRVQFAVIIPGQQPMVLTRDVTPTDDESKEYISMIAATQWAMHEGQSIPNSNLYQHAYINHVAMKQDSTNNGQWIVPPENQHGYEVELALCETNGDNDSGIWWTDIVEVITDFPIQDTAQLGELAWKQWEKESEEDDNDPPVIAASSVYFIKEMIFSGSYSFGNPVWIPVGDEENDDEYPDENNNDG